MSFRTYPPFHLEENAYRHFFDVAPHRMMQKWDNYFDVYARHLARFRDHPVTFLEIGISQGGSLDMWRRLLAPGSLVIGVDVNPRCKRFENELTLVFTGDQADSAFWAGVLAQVPQIDIVLDDGGHTMEQQINTFNALFPKISDTGLYMCEDTHTSYTKEYGGGYKSPGSFIEFTKGFIDSLHAWHTREVEIDMVTRMAHSVHFYDGLVAIEKHPMKKPVAVQKENPGIDG